jgi:hypothetical protein
VKIDEELLGFAGVQPGLEQSRGVGMRRARKNAGRTGNRRRALGRIDGLHRLSGFLQQHDAIFIAVGHHGAFDEQLLGGSVEDCTCALFCQLLMFSRACGV